MNFHGWDFPQTLRAVSDYLGLKDEDQKPIPKHRPANKNISYNNVNQPREWARIKLREVFLQCGTPIPS
jgi:hypothetical protein